MPVIEMSELAPCPTKRQGRQCQELKAALEEIEKLKKEIDQLCWVKKNLFEKLTERNTDLF